jgi:hypothetical protein
LTAWFVFLHQFKVKTFLLLLPLSELHVVDEPLFIHNSIFRGAGCPLARRNEFYLEGWLFFLLVTETQFTALAIFSKAWKPYILFLYTGVSAFDHCLEAPTEKQTNEKFFFARSSPSCPLALL